MLDFLNNLTIDLKKIPDYSEFKKPFTVHCDKQICKILTNGSNPQITPIMISNFKNNVIPHIKDDKLTVTHHQAKEWLGRFYCNDGISPCAHAKYIKHTLFRYQNWLDIDMRKGHPSILSFICSQSNMECREFDDVVKNFDILWPEIASYYKQQCNVVLSEDNVKYFFNLCIYGGGYSTWIKKLANKEDSEKYGYPVKVIPSEIPIHPKMEAYKNRCRFISDAVFRNNIALRDAVFETGYTEYKWKCTTMSYFCGIIENDIVYFTYNYLVKKGAILPNECLPEMDGICMSRLPNVNYENIVARLNKKLSGMNVKFDIKPYKPFHITDEGEKKGFVLGDILEMRNQPAPAIAENIESTQVETIEATQAETQLNTDWDLSEASFAKKLKELCFPVNLLYTGKGKDMDGYLFNGVYWEELSLHNSEIQKQHFDKMYSYYLTSFNASKDKFNESQTKSIVGTIKSLNQYLKRSNIIKIFKADNYVADIEWNKNKNLFVFDDCVYDLELGAFTKSNPQDYMNMSCGYNYNDLPIGQVQNAKQEIQTFIESIIRKEDCDYFSKLISSFVKQDNIEEKGYFWLGTGRNGKGTMSSILKRALGKYWGDLNMDYYTNHSKGEDTPNQNLFLCASSRVLSSSEIADGNLKNQAVKFISSKFKGITGRDTIYARELGTKRTAKFEAGKILIQTNVMPSFSKIDISLKERIVVIDFPYSFVENPTESFHRQIDMKLKDKFNRPEFRIAMISLLFENYKLYKQEFKIPASVKQYTNNYFSGESLVCWINKNLALGKETDYVELSEISSLFLLSTDKKLSVKNIKDELESAKLKVKRYQGYDRLYGYTKVNDVKMTREQYLDGFDSETEDDL